jgi:hypothetical protein
MIVGLDEVIVSLCNELVAEISTDVFVSIGVYDTVLDTGTLEEGVD